MFPCQIHYIKKSKILRKAELSHNSKKSAKPSAAAPERTSSGRQGRGRRGKETAQINFCFILNPRFLWPNLIQQAFWCRLFCTCVVHFDWQKLRCYFFFFFFRANFAVRKRPSKTRRYDTWPLMVKSTTLPRSQLLRMDEPLSTFFRCSFGSASPPNPWPLPSVGSCNARPHPFAFSSAFLRLFYCGLNWHTILLPLVHVHSNGVGLLMLSPS